MSPLLASFKSARGYGLTSYTAPVVDSFDAIATTVVTSNQTSTVAFVGIPQSYRHLQLRTSFVGTSGSQDAYIRFNGVEASGNYTWHEPMRGPGSSGINYNNAGTSASFMYLMTNATDPNYPVSAIVDILDYSKTDRAKTIQVTGGRDTNGGGFVDVISGAYYGSSDAIHTVTLYVPGAYGFNSNSTFTLYGIR